MLGENYISKDKNHLILPIFICIIISFQSWYFSQLKLQNQELINLNKEVLSSYKELIDSQLKYNEDVNYMRITAENLEKQNKELMEETEKLMEKTEKLNELFFDQMY